MHTGSAGDRVAGLVRGRQDLGQCEGWYTFNAHPTPGPTATIRRYGVSAAVALDAGLSFQDWTIAPGDVGGSTDIWFGNAIVYDEDDDSIILMVDTDGASVRRLAKFKDGSFVWVKDGWAVYDVPRKAKVTRSRLALWLEAGTNTKIRVIDTATGDIQSEQQGWSSLGANRTFYDPNKQMLLNVHANGIHQAWPGRLGRRTAPLGAIVTDLCARAGLPAADLDTSELTDAVRGYGIARQVSIRGALELLAAAYNFDGVESDYRLKFRKRGRSSERVIAEDELVPVNSEGEAFVETRAQDVDLPVRFTVRYNDAGRDLDVGSQTVKRIIEPSPTVHSQNEATLDLPLTLTAQEAKEVALRQCFSPWLERIMHRWALTWEHIDLDPGCVPVRAR